MTLIQVIKGWRSRLLVSHVTLSCLVALCASDSVGEANMMDFSAIDARSLSLVVSPPLEDAPSLVSLEGMRWGNAFSPPALICLV